MFAGLLVSTGTGSIRGFPARGEHADSPKEPRPWLTPGASGVMTVAQVSSRAYESLATASVDSRGDGGSIAAALSIGAFGFGRRGSLTGAPPSSSSPKSLESRSPGESSASGPRGRASVIGAPFELAGKGTRGRESGVVSRRSSFRSRLRLFARFAMLKA